MKWKHVIREAHRIGSNPVLWQEFTFGRLVWLGVRGVL
jgi:hypothetical protein